MYFLFERTYGNKNRREFIVRTDRKRGRIVENEKRLWTGAARLKNNWEVKFIQSLCDIPAGGGGRISHNGL